MAEARRTLVKSPPELWAEVSDPESLARHLGAFGEVRITRVEPETTVAWEGDRARGTVELEASGWGTKVRLTAEPVEVEEPALQQPLSAPDEGADPAPAEPSDGVAATQDDVAPAEPAEPASASAPAVATGDEGERSDGDANVSAAAAPPKRGFFARLFRRRRAEEPAVAAPDAPAPETELVAAAPEEPAPEPEPEPAATAAPEPEPEPEPAATTPDALEVPTPEGEIRVARLADEEAAEVLGGVLDTLGAAHHRPFSR